MIYKILFFIALIWLFFTGFASFVIVHISLTFTTMKRVVFFFLKVIVFRKCITNYVPHVMFSCDLTEI